MADLSKLRRLFPHGSKAFLSLNADAGLQDSEPERLSGSSLDKVSQRKEKGFACAHVRITAFTVRPRDADNLAGGCKALIDGMRYFGLISNDDPYSIELEVKQRHVGHFDQEKTLVEIEYK